MDRDASAVVEPFEKGDLKGVQALFEEDADQIDEPIYKDGKRPLHLAAIYGQAHIVEYLLREQVDVNSVDRAGLTALHFASKYGHVDVAKLLIDRGAALSMPNKVFKQTPLHMAVLNSRPEIVIQLVKAGANREAEDKEKLRPLHVAAEKGELECAGQLVAGGADVNASDKAGFTPLHLAVEHRRDDIVALLVRHGANCNKASKYKWTPLHLAAVNGGIIAVKYLRQGGADVYAATAEGKTAQQLAAENDQALVLPLLSPSYKPDPLEAPSRSASNASNCSGAAGHANGKSPRSMGNGNNDTELSDQMRGLGMNGTHTRAGSGGMGVPYGSHSDITSGSCNSVVDAMLVSFRIKEQWTRCPFCAPASESQSVPEIFLCPLSRQLMKESVVALDGFSYEKRAISDWYDAGNRTSPLTGEVVRSTALIPNLMIRCAIKEWQEWRDREALNRNRPFGY